MGISFSSNLDQPSSQWTGLLVVTLAILLWRYLSSIFARDPRHQRLAESLPGPWAWPLMGNLFQPVISGSDAINNLIEYPKKYGPVFRLWMGKYLAVCFSDAADVEQIYSSSKTAIGKGHMIEPFRDAWGDGLFSANVPLWKEQKKMYTYMFSKNVMHYYVPAMNEFSRRNVELLREFENGSEFDSWNILPHLTFGVIIKTQFDMDADKMARENLSDFHNLAEKATAMSLERMTSPWCQFQFIDKLFYKRKSTKLRKQMEEYAEKILEEKHSILQNVDTSKINYLTKSENHSGNITGAYITAAYKHSSEKQNKKLLYDAILTMLVGGTDTTAIVLGFIFLELATNQDIQNRLYEEIHNLYGDSNRDAQIEDFDQLPYLEQVVLETLRLYPIAPMIVRNVDADVQIGNRVYPAGTQLIIDIISMHYNEKYYANPTKFDPEHFSAEARNSRPKHAFSPFAGGPRKCLGMIFAMVEIKIFMISMLREYSFYTTTKLETLKLSMHFLLVSDDGYKMSIRSRKKL